MAWWSRLLGRRGSAPRAGSSDPSPRAERGESSAHLAEFARTKVGVEAYLEPATNDTGLTLLLITTDGEWTRRRVPDAATARRFAQDLAMPFYDVNFTGYPQRMRDYNARQRAAEKARRRRP
ncbi:oxidoreductase [uncultured Pseudokineococcus sp.]|uniref:oxidoreductase n=1 Tax=uncultured Pseudokineococcus sp. TaxID=1642928 RepID=UPI003439DF99